MDVFFRLRVLVLVLVAMAMGSRAFAQSDDEKRAGARATATAGIRAMDEGRFADAAALFSRAEALMHAPTHLLYYARACVKLGRLVEANEAYVKILRETLPPTAPNAFLEAQKAAAAEEPKVQQRVPRLTILVSGPDAKKARVTVNGTVVPQPLVGIAAPFDPGELVVEAAAPGWKSDQAKVSLGEGARETVRLTLSDRDTTTAPALVETTPTAVKAPRSGLQVAGWISVGVGVAGLGVGTYFLVDNRNNRDSASALCTLPNGVCPTAQRSTIESLDSQANTSAIISWIGYGVGGAAVVAGVVMLVLSRGHGSEAPPPKSAVVQPWVGPGSLGVSGSF